MAVDTGEGDALQVNYYVFEPEAYAKLAAINRRLFSDKSLTPDERRDLANAMNAVLCTAIAR